MRTPALIILLLFSLHTCWGQTDTTHKQKNKPHICHVKLVDGSSYKGIIENSGDSMLLLRSSSGVLVHIPRNKIHSVERVEVRSLDSLAYVSPTAGTIGQEYYVFTRSAFLFRKKSVYGSSAYAVFFNLNYACSKNISVGISGTPILAPLVATVKGNFMLGHKFYLGTSVGLGTLSWLGSKTYMFGSELKLTFGDEFRNFTFTCGYGELDLWRVARRRRRGPATPGNFYERFYSPYAGISASTLAFRRTYLAAEAFVYPNINVYTLSIAARTNVWQRFSLAGGFILLGSSNLSSASKSPLPFWFITLPMVGFSYRF